MKKNVMFGLLFLLGFLVSSCSNDLDMNRCKELILEHPFMKLQHVGVSPKELPEECKSVFAGMVEDGYVRLLKHNDDAYFYYLYGFDIENLRNLIVEEKQAYCEFDLVEINKTPACNYIKDDRIDGERMPCKATFVRFEKAGWRLVKVQCSERLFTINKWNGNNIDTVWFK